MKKMLLFAAVLPLLALAMTARGLGNRSLSVESPALDPIDVDSLVDDSMAVDPDIDYAEMDTVRVDSVAVDPDFLDEGEEEGGFAPSDMPVARPTFCEPNYELLGEFDEKMADYSLTHPKDSERGLTFSADIFQPMEGVKKGGAYLEMVRSVLGACCSGATLEGKDVEKMIEAKWAAVKANYKTESAEIPLTYSYRTAVSPAWQWAKGARLTTYKVEDEVYTGGAHGMNYEYYLTISEEQNRLMGLTDFFPKEKLPAVFELIAKKLVENPQTGCSSDPDIWPPTADISGLTPEAPMALSNQLEQYEGKWYPRPARTECGIVFSYAPYMKASYAVGTIHVLLTDEDLKALK